MSDWRIKLYRGVYAAVRSHEGRTERVSLRTRDLGEARRRLADQLAKPAGDTVGELMDAYIADKEKTAVRPQNIKFAWGQSKATFAHLRPDQITRQVCRDYIRMRTRLGRQPATIRKEIEVIRAGLRFHKRDAGAVFELPRQPPPNDRYLTHDEARRLARAARKMPHIRAFIVLALTTAARQSALLQLTWDRVDFRNRIIHLAVGDADDEVRKRRARVPINRRAYLYLRVLQASATTNNVIEWGGHRVLSVKKGFRSAAVSAGLMDVTPHTLRHTAASWMAMNGVPMFEISKYLGHSDARLTERRYAHLSPEYLRTAANSLRW